MPKYCVNTLLVKKLSSILELSGTDIANRCGIWPATLNRYLSGRQQLPIDVLIQLCNKMRIPIYYFISINGTSIIPTREQLTITADKFKQIRWDHEVVESTFGEHSDQIHWADVAASIGIGRKVPHEMFRLKRRFTLTRLMDICNALQLDPFQFLVDPNRMDGKKSFVHTPAPPEPVVIQHEDTDGAKEELYNLRGKVSALESEVSALRAKLEKVLAALPILRHPDIIYDLPEPEIPMAAESSKL